MRISCVIKKRGCGPAGSALTACTGERSMEIKRKIQVGRPLPMQERILLSVLLFAAAIPAGATADTLPAATAFQNWYTVDGGTVPSTSFGPIGPSVWIDPVPNGFTGSPPRGYTDVSLSAGPLSVEADSTIGQFNDPNAGNPFTDSNGAIAEAYLYFDYEVVYTGNGTPVGNVPVVGNFDFMGTVTGASQGGCMHPFSKLLTASTIVTAAWARFPHAGRMPWTL
jgi:hypothetical protein